ncbi:MAG: DUF748 domain-containing protein [Thiobacillus sp.]|jgi:uncharacterized protein involved in outer membrane biogenesis|uniref:DUF748 domain-containing protein n=1 Tax=Thiobacillus sp. TaxID=924 RepID=UPI002895372E|nr:DUF748 domain-containing protein [Thiobacillus sp.]MDT3705397.1 DUF748 domain-containing protein [Thiobacillus sp.]
MGGRIVKIALSLPFLVAVGLFGLYLVFGFFLVDPLAQKLLPWIGEEKLASRLSAEQVKFNPLTLEATVDGLKLAEKSGAPLASFDRLYLNIGTSGLFRWAWRIQDIQLERPRATLEIRRGGTLNWAALIARLNKDKQPPSDTIARVLIDHVKIENGDIQYTDANRVGEPFTAVLAPLGIELDGLSTLPEDRGDYLIAARLPEQGGTLKWKGDVGLNPLASRGEVGLEGVRLANLLRVIKSPRNFGLPSGTLAAGLRYRFAMVRKQGASSGQPGEDVPWLQVSGANLVVRDLALAPRGGGALKDSNPQGAEAPHGGTESHAPVLELAEARVSNGNFDLDRRTVEVASVSLNGGRVTATRDAKGILDWQTLFAPAETPAAAKPASRAAVPIVPWKIGVREIRLTDWSARFTDRGFAEPFGIDATDFGLTAALAGEIGETADLDIGPVNAALGPVQVLSGARPVAGLQRAALVNAGLNLAKNRVAIEAVQVTGVRTTVALDKNKALNWSGILKKAAGAPEAVPGKAGTEVTAPMDVQLARLGIDGIEVGFVDQSPARPIRLDLVDGFVTLKDLSLDMITAAPPKESGAQKKGEVPLQAGFALKQGGRFDARGAIRPGARSGRLDLKLAGLSLRPFAPYVNQFAALNLHSGAASTHGKLAFEQAKSGMKLSYGGGFAVDDLAITEEDTGDAFLGWKRLSTESLAVGLNPDRGRINELVALNPFGKVIIFEDKSTNLQRILRTPAETPVAGGAPKPQPKAQPRPADQPPAFPVAVERVRIVGGNAEFADLSLTPQFGTRMHDLSGVVAGLSTDPATTAQVELDGKVDDFGSARVRGTIQPFHATEFTDLTLTFRNLEMTNLTPYSGKFAGRRIDSGKLSVDLEYKIKDRQLTGANKFIVNKLKLGERVESPDALKLPLDLAIALLEDSNGIIDLDLPVSGSLDDPQFSYGKIIWKALVNVLTKLVTAPFRALGKLLGVSDEKLGAIGFDPGSSELLPPEQEKLKAVSEALAKRPTLTLTLEPGYDPDADRRALQELAMRREAAAAAGFKLAPGEAPGPVDVNHYKIQSWLEDRYAELAGKAEYQQLRASYQDKDAGAAARILESRLVERLGRQFKTRDTGPVSAFHAELLERLTRQTKIDDAALIELARVRGQAVRDALVGLGLDSGRVGIAAPAQQPAKDKLVDSRMSLGVAQQAAAEPAPAATTP